MRQTVNYKLNIPEGSDYVNPLVQNLPNFTLIDEIMKDNERGRLFNYGVTKTGNIFTVDVTNKDAQFFRFIAPADFEEGDKINLNEKELPAIDQSGNPLTAKAFIGGAHVICFLSSTDVCCPVLDLDSANLLVVLTNTGSGGSGGETDLAKDSEKLGGQLPSYYAKQSDIDTMQTTINSLLAQIDILKSIEVVSNLPETPDPEKLYFITGE